MLVPSGDSLVVIAVIVDADVSVSWGVVETVDVRTCAGDVEVGVKVGVEVDVSAVVVDVVVVDAGVLFLLAIPSFNSPEDVPPDVIVCVITFVFSAVVTVTENCSVGFFVVRLEVVFVPVDHVVKISSSNLDLFGLLREANSCSKARRDSSPKVTEGEGGVTGRKGAAVPLEPRLAGILGGIGGGVPCIFFTGRAGGAGL